jgi:hypothetical protein
MAGIMADRNIEGHFAVLLRRIWTSAVWESLWESLEIEVESFERLGIPYSTPTVSCGSSANNAKSS